MLDKKILLIAFSFFFFLKKKLNRVIDTIKFGQLWITTSAYLTDLNFPFASSQT